MKATRAIVLVGLLAGLCTCQPSAPASQSIRYSLSWNFDGLDGGVDASRFEWTSSDGLTVEVEQLFLSDFAVQLMPCEESTGEEAWLRDFEFGVAYAGHGELLGPAALPEPVAEFLARTPRVLDPIEAPAGFFCQFHYLVARQPTPTGLPDGLDPQTSLYVRGRVRRANPAEARDFEIHSKLAHGILQDLPAPVGADPATPAGVGRKILLDVTIERSLVGLFAGLTWEDFSDPRVDRTLLLNLMNETTLQVTRREM